jgi:hypothetical protein
VKDPKIPHPFPLETFLMRQTRKIVFGQRAAVGVFAKLRLVVAVMVFHRRRSCS